MDKRKIIIIGIPVLLICVVFLFVIFNSSKIKGIDGNEWNLKVKGTVDTSKAYLENFDNTITLYLSNVMTDEAFSNELNILHKQWKVIKSDYKQFLQENPISPNSDTVASANGYTALNNYYKEMDLLFKELLDNTISKDTVSYIYLAHQQKIISYYASYYLSYSIITGNYDNIQEYESTGILD